MRQAETDVLSACTLDSTTMASTNTTKSGMNLSDLNYDVIFEVFLNFVAIDWDGPFTLMLVCTKWSKIVISKPRLWTWVMVDDTQADWKERVDACVYLSKNLPLQIVLRAPFASQISMAYLTRRCTTIIIECPYVYREKSITPWPSFIFISYEHFHICRAELEDLNNSVALFLKDAPLEKMRILSGDKDHAAFAYSMWSIHKNTMQKQPLNNLLTGNTSNPVTYLRFRAGAKASALVRLGELWDILPLLSHLTFLEVSDSIVKWNIADLPHITLQRLETFAIDSSTNDLSLSSFKVGAWAGLFTVLGDLSAPNLETLILCGSIDQILEVMMKNSITVRPLKLITDITALDVTLYAPVSGANPTWCSVHSFTICIPYSEKIFSYALVDEVTTTAHAILSLLPRTCSMQIFGRNAGILPLGTLEFDGFEQPDGFSKKFTSLVAGIMSSQGSFVFQTSRFNTEYITIENKMSARLLDFTSDIPVRPTAASLSHLEELRCAAMYAEYIISSIDLPNLRVLTLTRPPTTHTDMLFRTMVKREKALPRLTALHLEEVGVWKQIIMFAGNFHKATPQGGISTLKLPGFPHPSIYSELVKALNSGPSGYITEYKDRIGYQEANLCCHSCFHSRLSCYEKPRCTRFSTNEMVYIIKTASRHNPILDRTPGTGKTSLGRSTTAGTTTDTITGTTRHSLRILERKEKESRRGAIAGTRTTRQ